MSGANTRQVVAISDEIELRMKREFDTYPNAVEGRRLGEWVLMDYVDFVVHIFVGEKRAYYDIERLRKSATSLDVDQLKTALKEKVAATRKKAAAKSAAKKTATPAKKTVANKQSAGTKAVAAKKAVKKAAKKRP
jgi:ribosome-associated protein